MRRITKEEARILREKFPFVHIRRTVNAYYAEENYKAMKHLDRVDRRREKVVNADAKT